MILASDWTPLTYVSKQQYDVWYNNAVNIRAKSIFAKWYYTAYSVSPRSISTSSSVLSGIFFFFCLINNVTTYTSKQQQQHHSTNSGYNVTECGRNEFLSPRPFRGPHCY